MTEEEGGDCPLCARKENWRQYPLKDHGNCKGEWGLYGHPRGMRIKELTKVPYKILKKRCE